MFGEGGAGGKGQYRVNRLNLITVFLLLLV